MATAPVDYSWLSRLPTKAEVAAVRAEALDGAFGNPTAEQVRTAKSGGWAAVVIAGGFTTGLFVLITLVSLVTGGNADDVLVGLAMTAVVALIFVVLFAVVRHVVDPLAWQRVVRLILFGRTNGFTVEPVAEDRTLPGTLGERSGQHRSITNRVTWEHEGMPVEVAVYVEQASGRSRGRFTSPYVAIRLPQALPRMTFISRTAVVVAPLVTFGVEALPEDYPRQHRRRVRLVTAPADAALARQVFTDELIAGLANHAHPANAEVRGEWFLIYHQTGLVNLNQGMWRRTVALVDLVTRSVGAVVSRGPDPAEPAAGQGS